MDPVEAIVDIDARDGSRWRLDLRTTFERQAFWSGRYDESPLRLLESLLRPGAVVIDVGANIGFYTVRLGRTLERLGGGRVHAFEPIPANAARLAYNVRANGLEAIVSIQECALGSSDGRLAFILENEYQSSTGNASMIGASGEAAFSFDTEAAVTTLDGFVERAGLTSCEILKIDVEGAELEVLRGATATIERFRPAILAEYNAHWAGRFGWNREAYATFARDHGYVTRWLDELYDPVRAAQVTNVLLTPRAPNAA
jgi:FkbM family methyltransferase